MKLTILLIPLILLSSCTTDGNDKQKSKDILSTNTGIEHSKTIIATVNSTGSVTSNSGLPPEPDITLNNSTLGGIDSNQNGVRDDVEIFIYSRLTLQKDIDFAMSFAKGKCTMISYVLTGKKSDIAGATSGDIPLGYIEQALGQAFTMDLIRKIINTPERQKQTENVSRMLFNPNYGVESTTCSVPETLFGIAIPAEPSIAENTATLAGVDSDNNGVRDDVDRMLACNVVTENDYYQNILIARVKQKRLTTSIYTQEMFESDAQDINCVILRNKEPNHADLEYLIKKLTFNTPERLSKVRQDERNIHGMVLGMNESICPTAASYGLH